MKELIVFFIALVTLGKLSANIIHNGGGRSQHIRHDQRENIPVRHRNRISPTPSNEYPNGDFQEPFVPSRHRHHHGRRPERPNNVEDRSYSSTNPEPANTRGTQHERGRPTQTARLPHNSLDSIDCNNTLGINSRNQPHHNRRPETGKYADNTNDKIYFNNTDEYTSTKPPVTTKGNTTIDDRFLTNTGQNCNPGEVRDLVTNECRPEIKDD